MEVAFLAIICFGLLIALAYTLKQKEHYRCRVFELTNGEEGSNLVRVKPDLAPPPPPKKPVIGYHKLTRMVKLDDYTEDALNDKLLKLQHEGWNVGWQQGVYLMLWTTEEITDVKL